MGRTDEARMFAEARGKSRRTPKKPSELGFSGQWYRKLSIYMFLRKCLTSLPECLRQRWFKGERKKVQLSLPILFSSTTISSKPLLFQTRISTISLIISGIAVLLSMIIGWNSSKSTPTVLLSIPNNTVLHPCYELNYTKTSFKNRKTKIDKHFLKWHGIRNVHLMYRLKFIRKRRAFLFWGMNRRNWAFWVKCDWR